MGGLGGMRGLEGMARGEVKGGGAKGRREGGREGGS